MLTDYGVPFLRWLDEKALDEIAWAIADFHRYVKRWRELLEV